VRIVLTVSAVLASLGYGFVAWVALVVSGRDLVKESWFYYAALMPFGYLAFCIFSCWFRTGARTLWIVGIIVHDLALPLMFTSLLRLGLFLPVFAIMCFLTMKERIRVRTT